MKGKCTIMLLAGILLLLVSACGNQEGEQVQEREKASISQSQEEDGNMDAAEETTGDTVENNSQERGNQMVIEVNGQQFEAELYDNDTAAALGEMLPMTLNMEEMNGNEKYYFMDESLPSAAENIGTIQNGDIMLYGSDCLVLFFKTFETSYNYTRIGHIENAEEFAAALESGTVEVTFHMEQ